MTSQLLNRRTILTAAVGTLALAGCSSTSGSGKKSGSSADVNTRLKKAQDTLGSTSGYHVKVTSSLPSDFKENGIGNSEGDVTPSPQAFKGKVNVKAAGGSIDADVISIGHQTWEKTGVQASYSSFDPDQYHVPQPADLFSTTKGLPALLTKSKDIKENGKKLIGGQQVTIFKGTLDEDIVPQTIGFGRSRSAYTIEVGLDDQDRALTMTLSGPFYDSADATYTIEPSKYGQKVTISKPS